MKIRSHLMRSIEDRIRAEGWSQQKAAERFHVLQTRVSDLMRGKIDKFTIDTLVNIVVAAGLHVQIGVVELEAA